MLSRLSGRFRLGALPRIAQSAAQNIPGRTFSSEAEEEEREKMPYDCLIVGGGPAGLAASIRLKQLAMEKETDISVCVL